MKTFKEIKSAVLAEYQALFARVKEENERKGTFLIDEVLCNVSWGVQLCHYDVDVEVFVHINNVDLNGPKPKHRSVHDLKIRGYERLNAWTSSLKSFPETTAELFG